MRDCLCGVLMYCRVIDPPFAAYVRVCSLILRIRKKDRCMSIDIRPSIRTNSASRATTLAVITGQFDVGGIVGAPFTLFEGPSYPR